MAITKSARRAIGVAKRRRVFNLKRKAELSKAMKEIKVAIKGGKKDDALKVLPVVYKQLDKAAKTFVIAKGNADRKKSRLVKQISKLK